MRSEAAVAKVVYPSGSRSATPDAVTFETKHAGSVEVHVAATAGAGNVTVKLEVGPTSSGPWFQADTTTALSSGSGDVLFARRGTAQPVGMWGKITATVAGGSVTFSVDAVLGDS